MSDSDSPLAAMLFGVIIGLIFLLGFGLGDCARKDKIREAERPVLIEIISGCDDPEILGRINKLHEDEEVKAAARNRLIKLAGGKEKEE